MKLDGPVRGYASRDDQLFSRVQVMPSGCWEWQGVRRKTRGKEYGQLKVDGIMRSAHRVAYLLRVGPLGEDDQVLHRCDNPPCCNPEHLFKGSNDDNVADRVAKGRSARNLGEASPSAKLTESDVQRIRRMFESGMTNLAIAELFPVNDRMVSMIVRRKAWRHVA